MIICKTRFNRRDPAIFVEGRRADVFKHQVFRDERDFDAESNTITVLGVRNVIEDINATSDAMLTVGERVQAFLLGDVNALAVDRSGVYVDINGLPTNEHEIHAVISRANDTVRKHEAKNFKDAFEKISAGIKKDYDSAIEKLKKESEVKSNDAE